MPALATLDDMRQAARRRLPRMIYDYVAGGGGGETTLAANRADFARFRLEQRVLVDCSVQDLATTILGRSVSVPFMAAPVGFLGLCAPHGERQLVQAAHAAGMPVCLSSFSMASIGDLRQISPGPLDFQLYVLTDREVTRALVEAAASAGCGALMVTVDTAITNVRDRDVRNGFRGVSRMTPAMLARFALKPGWSLPMLATGMPSIRALDPWPEFGRGALAQAAGLGQRIDRTLGVRDIAWLRDLWPGKLVVKGVLSAEDAVKARDAGADAVVVSNHGGRQLDPACSTISVLGEIVDAVGPSFEVLVDGGFRRGSDIVTGLALGASGVMLGRPIAWGLAAGGAAGVARVIEILRAEMSATMALMGLDSIAALRARGRAALRVV